MVLIWQVVINQGSLLFGKVKPAKHYGKNSMNSQFSA
jgi:hypothetical protein